MGVYSQSGAGEGDWRLVSEDESRPGRRGRVESGIHEIIRGVRATNQSPSLIGSTLFMASVTTSPEELLNSSIIPYIIHFYQTPKSLCKYKSLPHWSVGQSESVLMRQIPRTEMRCDILIQLFVDPLSHLYFGKPSSLLRMN